jgi:hypothetical protein
LPASVELFDMTEETSKARAALSAAVKDAAAANAVAEKARDAVTAASTNLSQAERDLAAARTAVEEARGVQRPLADLLADAGSDEERWQLIDEQNISKGRPAVTADELREARALVLDSEDRVIVARSELEQLQAPATSATAAANRANERRQKAVNELVRPECARLLQTAERLTAELGEARLALRFVGDNLTAPYVGEERREIRRHLNQDMLQLFPAEYGITCEPSAALAAWKAFAEAVSHDASTPFPST